MMEADVLVNRRKRRRAIIRLVLGRLQIIGAAMGVYFLITTGVTALTIWTVGITGIVWAVSRLLLKVVWPERT